MNGHAMKKILHQWFSKDSSFVCGINELTVKTPGIYMVNTGNHWISLYVTEDTVEFFDSFGRSPKYVHEMLKFEPKTLIVHSKRLQQFSSQVCGLYCLVFAFVRARNMLSEFFAMFSKDRKSNDQKIVYMIRKLVL